MPPKNVATRRTITATSRHVERATESQANIPPQPAFARTSPSPQTAMVSAEYFNLLFTQVQKFSSSYPSYPSHSYATSDTQPLLAMLLATSQLAVQSMPVLPPTTLYPHPIAEATPPPLE